MTSARKRKANGAKSRAKGREGEREAARVAGGKRTSRTGTNDTPDIVDQWGTGWEVKRPKQRLTFVYNALEQNENWPRAMMRDDRKPWIVIMYWDEYKELMERASDA